MIYKNVFLDYIGLVKNFDKSNIIFHFLDNFYIEMKKISKSRETIDDIIFINLKTQNKIIVNIDKANSVLKLCFYKYYLDNLFKFIDLEIETNNIFILKRSLFFLLKNIFILKTKINKIKFKKLLKEVSKSFEFPSQEEYDLFCNYIENSNFNLVDLNKKFKPFFEVSTETFFFVKYHKDAQRYSRVQTYHDLKNYLKYNKFLNEKIISYYVNDRIIQSLIFVSFINFNFAYDLSKYSDNTFNVYGYFITSEKLPDNLDKDAYIPAIYKKSPRSKKI